MKKKFDVITAMDVCMDILVNLGKVSPAFSQKEQMIEDFHMTLGGSACIFSSQCAKLQLKTAGTGKVGADSLGKVFVRSLEETGVDISYIRVCNDLRTGAGVALNKEDGDRAILTYMGTIGKIDRESFEELANNTRHIHIASYYLMKEMQSVYLDILPGLKEKGVTVSLDTNWDPQERFEDNLMELLPYVDVLLQNEQELLAISKQETLKNAVADLQGKVPLLVLKRGEKGAEAYERGIPFSVKTTPVVPVDTVGAGDSFDAGFIYGYLKGLPVKTCLEIGCFCGGKNVTAPGGIMGQPVLKELNLVFP